MPGHVLASIPMAYDPNRRTAWPAGRQPLVRGGGKGAGAGAGRARPPPNTEPSGPVTKLDPLDHLQPIPAAHWTHGGLGGVKFRPLASLFAQLLF
jgi:hypothetical protein